jgi:imidazolonepropionase-like amidohydrolase
MASGIAPIVLDRATVLDVLRGERIPNQRVTVAEGRIQCIEPAEGPIDVPTDAKVFDVGGRTLMPGLCDAHVHVTAWSANLAEVEHASPSYTALRAAGLMEAMLLRGFTTVRDGGGADYGLAQAVEEGHIRGPRLLFCGQGLSQTGGHGDQRQRGESYALDHIVDGVDAVRKACREEIRKGAHHIKLMLSGGVASPTDRITNTQFSLSEIRAAVEEAEMAGLYCMGHAYTARAVNRALDCGVRSLEHCNLIDESSVARFLKHNAFMVPTLATYEALAREGVDAGMPKALNDKVYTVLDAGVEALRLAHEAGVKLAYGTDLLGELQRYQLTEFALREEVQHSVDIIRSATCIAAELFGEVGESGVVAEGARADLLIVDGDPLSDLSCLQDPERYLTAIIKGGKFVKGGWAS